MPPWKTFDCETSYRLAVAHGTYADDKAIFRTVDSCQDTLRGLSECLHEVDDACGKWSHILNWASGESEVWASGGNRYNYKATERKLSDKDEAESMPLRFIDASGKDNGGEEQFEHSTAEERTSGLLWPRQNYENTILSHDLEDQTRHCVGHAASVV